MVSPVRPGGGSAGGCGNWRACRCQHDGAPHLRAGLMQGTGCFPNGGAGCQDVVDDDAGTSEDPAAGTGFDLHGAPDALRAGSPAQPFLATPTTLASQTCALIGALAAAGPQGAGSRLLAQGIRYIESWQLPSSLVQEQVDRAEPPADE